MRKWNVGNGSAKTEALIDGPRCVIVARDEAICCDNMTQGLCLSATDESNVLRVEPGSGVFGQFAVLVA